MIARRLLLCLMWVGWVPVLGATDPVEILLPRLKDPNPMVVSQTLRARLAPMTPVDAMQQVLGLMRRHPSNESMAE